jgi:hypothetical protein
MGAFENHIQITIPGSRHFYLNAFVHLYNKNETMKNLFFVLASAIVFVLASCTNYGKKIKINDTLEIYLKGDSVNENDARKLGNYLARLSGPSKSEKSLQLSKDSGKYVVRMVVDEKKIKADSTFEESFVALKTLIETQVFNNQPVKLTLTDNRFNDLKSY